MNMMALLRILPFARIAVWCGSVGFSAMVAFPQNLPDIYSDEIHGDPPFLSEPDWRPLLNGSSLAGWQGQDGKAHEWFTSKSVRWRRVFAPTRLEAAPAPGDRIVNGKTGRTTNLVTEEKCGDLELYLEFMTARGSNSGVYLHGLSAELNGKPLNWLCFEHRDIGWRHAGAAHGTETQPVVGQRPRGCSGFVFKVK
jgi:hypothetical protein